MAQMQMPSGLGLVPAGHWSTHASAVLRPEGQFLKHILLK